jgi:acetolactate synthase-1/2/3 large subunit
VVDIPKDVQFATGTYQAPANRHAGELSPRLSGDATLIARRCDDARCEAPVIYSGGGVINSGPAASRLLRELVADQFPITSTLMGLGAYPASGANWLGMLGMHGTYEANMTMHDCDVMVNIGARFDDRITGRIDVRAARQDHPHRYRPVLDQQDDPVDLRSSAMSAMFWRTWCASGGPRAHKRTRRR